MRRKLMRWSLSIALMGNGAVFAAAAEPPPLTRLEGPLVLDGRLDEEAWRQVPPVPLTVFEPVYAGKPSQRTEIRLAYDEDHLYLGAELFDSEPKSVRAGSLYRDRYVGDDTVGLIVDSFNDDRNARWFYTTPAGVRGDAAVADDMASGQGDFSWNGHWEARAHETATGWSAEMRIPFSTLGFRPRDGQLTMGLSVYRWLARHNERQVWPDVPPRWARPYAKPSKLVDVRLERVNGGRGLVLSPYASGGTVDGAFRSSAKREAGIDLRRRVGSGFALDVTVNTDFAQVEADAQQINLTRFPLFFPEKRPFFLENADIFDFAWEGDSRLFHSRHIGLRDGEPIRLWGGARVAGRTGAWDVGLLDMQAARHGNGRGENFGVARARRRSARSIVGGMVTTRTGLDGRFQATAGADLEWRVAGDDFLVLKAAHSSTRGGASGERFLARWQRRRRQGFSYEATLARASRGFAAGLSFDARRDFGHGAGRISYEWLLRGEGALRRVSADLAAEAYRRNRDGHVDTATIAPTLTVETTRGDALTLFATRRHEDVTTAFELPAGLAVPPGVYRFHETGVTVGTTSGRKLRGGATLRGGSFYDGRRWAIAPALNWSASRHLELGAEYERNALRFAARQESVVTDLVRLRVQAAWDIHASIALLAQYNDVARAWSVNARGRYHLREGTDFWVVYDDHPATAVAAAQRSRSVLAKVTWALVR